MATTNYYTYNGRIRGESASGIGTDYLTDALGSVTATVSQSQVVENTYRYKPYGATLAKTGTAPDPGFLWSGDTGSRPTGLAQSGQYNRARHYSSSAANWSSVDRIWPEVPAYSYAAGNPVRFIDVTGLKECDCSSGAWTNVTVDPLKVSPAPTQGGGSCGDVSVSVSLSGEISINGLPTGLEIGFAFGFTGTCKCTYKKFVGKLRYTYTSCSCVYEPPSFLCSLWSLRECLGCGIIVNTKVCWGSVQKQVLTCPRIGEIPGQTIYDSSCGRVGGGFNL